MFVLDASVMISQFASDVHTEKVQRWLSGAKPPFLVTDFAGVEFSSALMRWRRMKAITALDLAGALRDFDDWRARRTRPRNSSRVDFAIAEEMIRDPQTRLRTMAALYIAVARADGLTLVSLDKIQATAAGLLGVPCVVPA